jgi:hypothetical protein
VVSKHLSNVQDSAPHDHTSAREIPFRLLRTRTCYLLDNLELSCHRHAQFDLPRSLPHLPHSLVRPSWLSSRLRPPCCGPPPASRPLRILWHLAPPSSHALHSSQPQSDARLSVRELGTTVSFKRALRLLMSLERQFYQKAHLHLWSRD